MKHTSLSLALFFTFACTAMDKPLAPPPPPHEPLRERRISQPSFGGRSLSSSQPNLPYAYEQNSSLPLLPMATLGASFDGSHAIPPAAMHATSADNSRAIAPAPLHATSASCSQPNLPPLQPFDLHKALRTLMHCKMLLKIESEPDLSDFEELDLSDAKINAVIPAVKALVAYRMTQLRNAHKEDLLKNTTLASHFTLRKLSLAKNNITRLPVEIEQLTDLTELDLSGNMIAELPDSIKNLTNLRKLNVNWPAITRLPARLNEALIHVDDETHKKIVLQLNAQLAKQTAARRSTEKLRVALAPQPAKVLCDFDIDKTPDLGDSDDEFKAR